MYQMASGTAMLSQCSPKGFGRELQLMPFPHDTTYPFPTILFFRARAET